MIQTEPDGIDFLPTKFGRLKLKFFPTSLLFPFSFTIIADW